MAEQGQTAVAEAPQTEAVTPEQSVEAVQEDGQAAEQVSEAAEFDYSQINDDWVRTAADRSEVLRKAIEQAKNDGFNAGRQKRDKELRLERGSEETAKQYHAWVAEQIANGADPDEVAKQTPLWVKANRDVERVNAARSLVSKVSEAFDVAENERITSVIEAIADDPDQVEALAVQLVDAATNRRSSKHIAELTLDAIPKDHPLWNQIQERVNEEAAKELEARMQEQEPRKENPPRTSTGAPIAGDIKERLSAMSSQERTAYFMNLSDEERGQMWALAAPR